ncbi:hypothetical protein, partial [Thiolapillus sp.]|uniref:hypothetical protein n=1 Tax=Thiolapillus sp. TaxID=2017437 RepID=UPI003AF9547C
QGLPQTRQSPRKFSGHCAAAHGGLNNFWETSVISSFVYFDSLDARQDLPDCEFHKRFDTHGMVLGRCADLEHRDTIDLYHSKVSEFRKTE